MDTFSERLKELISIKNITQSELSRISGVSKSSISHYLKGDWTAKQDAIYAIAKATMTNEAWLMGYDNVPMAKHFEQSIPSGFSPLPRTTLKPRLGTIACGDPILAEQNVDDFDRVPDWIECDFTLKCHGDSMIGARIYDGDIVCIRQQPEVLNGEIAAVLIDGEATLKRVYVQQGRLTLMPENPSYQPLIYVGDELENIRIIGKATYFISKVQ